MTNKNFPRSIYIDTNILRKIGITNFGTPFLELKEWSQKFEAPFVVPQAVWLEWLSDFEQNIKKKSSQTIENLRSIEILLEMKQKQFKLPDDYSGRLVKTIRKKLCFMGIGIANTPQNISIEELVRMAAFKIKPFEDKKEKGFRDTIILYTILEDMKKKSIKEALFVTDDRIFIHDDVNQIVKKYKINLSVVFSLEEATDHIKNVLDDVGRKLLEMKKQKLFDFVKTRQDLIFKFIKKNAELTEDFITKGGFLSAKRDIFGQIEKVLEFEPVEIEGAFEAAKSPSEKQPPKNSEYILISVKTRLKIEYLPLLVFNRPSVKASDIDKFKEIIRNSAPRYYGDPAVVEVTRDPSVTALVKKDVKGNYVDLKLERVNTLF